MLERIRQNQLFQASHLMLLIGNTVMSLMLVIEAIRSDWERWPLIMIFIIVVASWTMHLRQILEPHIRLWIYAIMMMMTFFYYGIHPDSMADQIAIMACIMMLFTMTGIRGLITMAQMMYYLTIGYIIAVVLINNGANGLPIAAYINGRVILHVILLTLIAVFARTIIGKWEQVLEETGSEIEELTQATERLDDFLANASHEVRTPVNAVIGLTGVCLDREIDDDTRRDIGSIRQAGHRVAEQMSDILDYTEIDRDRLTNNPENYMMSSLLNDIVTELRPYFKPEIEFVLDVSTEIPNVMNTDVSKLKKILWHLMINGLKYTREGGVYVHITADKTEYGVNLCIDVSDTGIGMNEAEREHMFDRFYQADSSRARYAGGLGLGMSIVNGFVRAMGGFLTVNSSPDEGTTVHVCVPQKVVDPLPGVMIPNREKISLGAFFSFNKYPIPAVREYYNDLIRNIVKGLGVQIHGVDSVESLKKVVDSVHLTHVFVGMKEYETDPDYFESIAGRLPVIITADAGYQLPPKSRIRIMQKPLYCFPVAAALTTESNIDLATGPITCPGVRALVVDDEPMNLIVANGIFSRYGMIVETADSGPAAIEMCSENKYDIVFMDHMMPGMDGVEAMKQIRADIHGKSGPVFVALTANTVSTAREMFRREGFEGFVGKPIDRTELERVLKNILPPAKIVYEEPEETEPSSESHTEPVSVDTGEDSGTDTFADMSDMTESVAQAAVIEETPDIPDENIQEQPSGSGSSLDALRDIGIDTEVGMEYCQDDSDLYEMLLSDFAENAAENIEYLEECLQNDNLENYEIKIHSVKSTSRLIGAMALGDLAEDLEHKSHDRNDADVRAGHGEAIRVYQELAENIREVTS
ncbi:MAG: response regulator [Eubacterium sp.]|nr:response regulator [Eubacterium sp.]